MIDRYGVATCREAEQFGCCCIGLMHLYSSPVVAGCIVGSKQLEGRACTVGVLILRYIFFRPAWLLSVVAYLQAKVEVGGVSPLLMGDGC